MKNIELYIKQPDHEQKLRKRKQHRTDEQIRIGFVRFENVIAQRKSTKENRKNALEYKQPETFLQFVIRQIDRKKINKQERQTANHQWKAPRNPDQFDDEVNHQNAVSRKENRSRDDVIEILGQKKHIRRPGKQQSGQEYQVFLWRSIQIKHREQRHHERFGAQNQVSIFEKFTDNFDSRNHKIQHNDKIRHLILLWIICSVGVFHIQKIKPKPWQGFSG